MEIKITSRIGMGNLPNFTSGVDQKMLSPKEGITSSQASHVSNLCNQKAAVIAAKIDDLGIGNKFITLGGVKYELFISKPIPADMSKLLIDKGMLHATQAYLMEAIKYKDEVLETLRGGIRYTSVFTAPSIPEYLMLVDYEPVKEEWAWNKLTQEQWQEYLEEEALASHIGKFIHDKGKLTSLRKDLRKLKELEWYMASPDNRVPVKVEPHETSNEETLYDLHEQLANLHRAHEKRVNYFKAMIKNMTNDENARLANVAASENAVRQEKNSVMRQKYNDVLNVYYENTHKESQLFEVFREEIIKFISGCRIKVPKRFKDTIDLFLKDV